MIKKISLWMSVILYLVSAYLTPSPFGDSPYFYNVMSVVLEYLSIGLFVAVFLKIKSVPFLFWFFLIYYTVNLALFPFLGEYENAAMVHVSIKGVLYLLLALTFFNLDVDYKKNIMAVALLLSISQVLKVIGGISLNHFLNFGAMGSYVGLICLVALYLNEKKLNFKSVWLLLAVFLANSVSSVISFLVSYIVNKVKNLKFKSLVIIFSLLILVSHFVINYVGLDNVRIANKGIETILEGSGRIKIYKHCIDWMQTDLPIFGLGLLNEGLVFKNGHPLGEGPLTCHSSVLSTITSYGMIGIIFLFVFYFYMLAAMYKLKDERKSVVLMSIIIFGTGAAFMPGTGSPLLSVLFLVLKPNAKTN